MKKIAYALSILLMASLLGCGTTATTKGVAPVQVESVATAPSPTPSSSPTAKMAVTPAPVVSAGGWTTTNAWSGDKGITTDPFDANGEPILVNMETGSKDFQISVQNDKGNILTTMNKTESKWNNSDKKTTGLERLSAGQYTFKVVTEGPWSINIQQKANQNR